MISVKFISLPDELVFPVGELCRSLSIEISESAPVCVSVKQGDKISLSGSKEAISLTYGKKNELYRAISLIPAFLRGDEAIEETDRYDMLCYMADMSRNAVFSIEGAKRMIRYMATMGYNSLMLYTEDTYEIPEYPFFGYMRGRYTKEELQYIDSEGEKLGIDKENMAKQINLTYTKVAEEAYNSVKEGKANCSFILNPTRVDEIRDVALAGEKMPQKSTYFYPKLITGLVMNKID